MITSCSLIWMVTRHTNKLQCCIASFVIKQEYALKTNEGSHFFLLEIILSENVAFLSLWHTNHEALLYVYKRQGLKMICVHLGQTASLVEEVVW